MEEPLAWAEEYPIQWREPKVDLAELAKLRWIQGFSQKQLADRYGRTEIAVKNYFQILRRKEFQFPGLLDEERELILLASKQRPLKANRSRPSDQ